MSKLDLNDLSSDKARVKYACAKQAVTLSEENPAALYPERDVFVSLLDSENQILRWTAIRILGNLSGVDDKRQMDSLLPRLIGFLNAGKMITAGTAAAALAVIARNRPEYLDKILDAIIQVEHYTYDTPECRNIAIGHVLKALGAFKQEIRTRQAIIEFVRRQTQNSRPATRKKAEMLLKALTARGN